jgi:hypothetical protein
MSAAYEGWALLELMGHRQRVGRVSEVEAYGGKLLRIDIPAATEDGEPFTTEFYGATSVYSLRPLSEAIARDHAKRNADPRPIQPLEYRLERQAGARPSYDDVGPIVENDDDL